LLHLLLERVAEWAAGNSEDDRERDDAVVDLNAPHHVELGNRPPQLRIDHLLERLQNLVAIDRHAASVASTSRAGARLWAAKRSRMASESTTRWPLLNERLPIAPTTTRAGGRRPPRSVWLLTGLAFLCGGLVSAAGFSIGWRHQAQRNTDAETALATATARTHGLQRRVAALEATLTSARRAETRQHQVAVVAAASERAVTGAAAKVGADATASNSAAASVSSGAGVLTATADRIASELKTLETYLTTTPTGSLDPG